MRNVRARQGLAAGGATLIAAFTAVLSDIFEIEQIDNRAERLATLEAMLTGFDQPGTGMILPGFASDVAHATAAAPNRS